VFSFAFVWSLGITVQERDLEKVDLLIREKLT